jgi:hypothetical protein
MINTTPDPCSKQLAMLKHRLATFQQTAEEPKYETPRTPQEFRERKADIMTWETQKPGQKEHAMSLGLR